VKTYEEMVGNSLVTQTETACPDPNCQKNVVRKLKEETERRLQKTLETPKNTFGMRNKFKTSSSSY
jgi:hypothetical protein